MTHIEFKTNKRIYIYYNLPDPISKRNWFKISFLLNIYHFDDTCLFSMVSYETVFNKKYLAEVIFIFIELIILPIFKNICIITDLCIKEILLPNNIISKKRVNSVIIE